jgi:hypothetical protein
MVTAVPSWYFADNCHRQKLKNSEAVLFYGFYVASFRVLTRKITEGTGTVVAEDRQHETYHALFKYYFLGL